MRVAISMLIAILAILVMALTAGCGRKTRGDAVREAYDDKAAAIDAQAARQRTPTARKIYKDRAAAIREEGRDREKGLEGGMPASGAAPR